MTVGGRTYFLRPLTLADLGAIEFHLLAARGNPVERVQAAMPDLAGDPEAARHLMALATDDLRRDRAHRYVRAGDLLAWIDTQDGIAYTAWLLLRAIYPADFGRLDQAAAVFGAATEAEREEFRRRRDLISGLDATAAADWPTRDELSEVETHRPTWIPWKQWARSLIAEFMGWTLPHLAGLTLYQARLMQAGERELGGVVRRPWNRETAAALGIPWPEQATKR